MEDHRTVTYRQITAGMLSLLSYLKKIALVFSFNCFFTSPTGLGVQQAVWDELSIAGRIKTVLRDNGLWIFKALLLFQLAPVVDHAPDSSASIFRTYHFLLGAIRRVRKTKTPKVVHPDDQHVSFVISAEAVEALTEDSWTFRRCYDQWNGLASQCVPVLSVED